MNKIVDRVTELYLARGDKRYGEHVTQLEHALQTAALARRSGARDALVVASLLHDIGYLLEASDGTPAMPERNLAHEKIGAHWLSKWFRPHVTEPIRLHVAAKRYLCSARPSYHTVLSTASAESLEVQGGPMNQAEMHGFRNLDYAADALRLRSWDEKAKVAGRRVAPWSTYEPLLAALARPER